VTGVRILSSEDSRNLAILLDEDVQAGWSTSMLQLILNFEIIYL
jgi:hypothetical protein